ncbi:uncharacterized protein LOC141850131 [Brevipalpus obovatus]|uniref:uncharacterized protein LOC141850131 n=1 Tax=Brevipalpus obovatus TaxID=246614 RepID=UPI003D9F0448
MVLTMIFNDSSSQPPTIAMSTGYWYQFGRWLLIILAIMTIVLDANKMYEQYQRAEVFIYVSKLDAIEFYSSSIITHITGLCAALEHQIWLSVLCRMISAFVYQVNLHQHASDPLPKDPSKLNKLIRKKIRQNPSLLNKRGKEDLFTLIMHSLQSAFKFSIMSF